jgi:hypothetical protein
MSRTITASFDGKVIIPDVPLSLPKGTKMSIVIDSPHPLPRGVSGKALNEILARHQINVEAVEEMERAIEEGCERIDSDEW